MEFLDEQLMPVLVVMEDETEVIIVDDGSKDKSVGEIVNDEEEITDETED